MKLRLHTFFSKSKRRHHGSVSACTLGIILPKNQTVLRIKQHKEGINYFLSSVLYRKLALKYYDLFLYKNVCIPFTKILSLDRWSKKRLSILNHLTGCLVILMPLPMSDFRLGWNLLEVRWQDGVTSPSSKPTLACMAFIEWRKMKGHHPGIYPVNEGMGGR